MKTKCDDCGLARDPGSCPNSYCKRKPDHPDLPPGINERHLGLPDTYGVASD